MCHSAISASHVPCEHTRCSSDEPTLKHKVGACVIMQIRRDSFKHHEEANARGSAGQVVRLSTFYGNESVERIARDRVTHMYWTISASAFGLKYDNISKLRRRIRRAAPALAGADLVCLVT